MRLLGYSVVHSRSSCGCVVELTTHPRDEGLVLRRATDAGSTLRSTIVVDGRIFVRHVIRDFVSDLIFGLFDGSTHRSTRAEFGRSVSVIGGASDSAVVSDVALDLVRGVLVLRHAVGGPCTGSETGGDSFYGLDRVFAVLGVVRNVGDRRRSVLVRGVHGRIVGRGVRPAGGLRRVREVVAARERLVRRSVRQCHPVTEEVAGQTGFRSSSHDAIDVRTVVAVRVDGLHLFDRRGLQDDENVLLKFLALFRETVAADERPCVLGVLPELELVGERGQDAGVCTSHGLHRSAVRIGNGLAGTLLVFDVLSEVVDQPIVLVAHASLNELGRAAVRQGNVPLHSVAPVFVPGLLGTREDGEQAGNREDDQGDGNPQAHEGTADPHRSGANQRGDQEADTGPDGNFPSEPVEVGGQAQRENRADHAQSEAS